MKRALVALALLAPVSRATATFALPDRLEGVRSVMVLRRDEPLFTEPSKGAARRGAAERGARLPVFELARGGGCSGRWFSVGPLAWICEEGAEASGASPPAEQAREATAEGLPHDYYFVGPDGSFGYGDLLVNTNGWDPAVLQRFRDDQVVQSIGGGIDHKATAEQIEHIATLIPEEWLEPSATGSAQQCADRVRKEFDYGADAVIMHGATPDELEPIVAAYRDSRP